MFNLCDVRNRANTGKAGCEKVMDKGFYDKGIYAILHVQGCQVSIIVFHETLVTAYNRYPYCANLLIYDVMQQQVLYQGYMDAERISFSNSMQYSRVWVPVVSPKLCAMEKVYEYLRSERESLRSERESLNNYPWQNEENVRNPAGIIPDKNII